MLRRIKAFTLIELLVVISIIALLIGILLPALGAARRTANQMKNGTQVRSIIQAAIIFAQSNGSFYPGLDSGGGVLAATSSTLTSLTSPQIHATPASNTQTGASPMVRLALLINGNFFTSDIAVSPGETTSIAKWPRSNQTSGSPFTGDSSAGHYSYALLALTDDTTNFTATATTNHTGRVAEWRDTSNAQAIVVTDRNIATGTADNTVRSIWGSKPGDWRGSVGFNDNHVEFLQHHWQNISTKYGAITNPGSTTTGDHLFITNDGSATTHSNALMISGFTG